MAKVKRRYLVIPDTFQSLHSKGNNPEHKFFPRLFGFITLNRRPVGAKYTLTQYNKGPDAACERIGLTVGKTLGTTRHGHRHAYFTAGGCATPVDKVLLGRFTHQPRLKAKRSIRKQTTRERLLG